MGFTAGIYAYPKHNGLTLKEIYDISHITDYYFNEWLRKNYSSLEEYIEKTSPEIKLDTYSKETLEYYIEYRKNNPDEFGSHYISTELGSWCSAGADTVHKWVRENVDKDNVLNDDGHVELSLDNILDLLSHCIHSYRDMAPEACNLNYAYTYVDNEEDPDEPDIVLKKCDGIEVTFEDGGTKRIDAFGELEFCAPRKYYDDYEAYAYMEGVDACLKILKNYDMKYYYIVYSGGW